MCRHGCRNAARGGSWMRQSFVAGLHQQSHIVQIPYLRGRRRNDLERLLAVFDQDLADRGSASDHNSVD